MSKFTDWFRGLGQKINSTKLGAFFKNWQDSGKVLPPAVGGVAESLLNKYTDAGATGRDVAINNMNRQNIVDQASLEVEGYKKAGLNPALMYGSGTSSAPTVSNSSSGGLQDLVALFTLPQQLQQMKANIELTREQAEQRRLDNVYLSKTLDARVRGQELANNLTSEQIEQIRDNRGLIVANLQKVIEETENEKEKRLLIRAQTAVQNATEKQIATLLPYQEALMSAQTEAQQMQAVSAFWAAAYQEKLVNSSYIDDMCNNMRAAAAQAYSGAELNHVNVAINNFKDDVQNGRVFNTNKKITQGKTFIGRAINYHANIPAKIFNFAAKTASATATAIAGPLSGLLK